ncbi:MAG: NAD(P)-dependent glycerol-3-phosphate dehydrogenase [Firmicutes bacterium]|nr:NAD(P)-dependent glycerol-3-phosphate dehydrogenase [Bacillota bacterium]
MKVTILGAGAYGLALSKVLVENKNEVVIWTPFEEEKNELLKTRKSSNLKEYTLDNSVVITTDLEESIRNSELIVIAIPTKFISDVCKNLKKYIKSNQHICIASKGIEQETYLFVHDIIKKQIKTKYIGVISGPSFAIDLVLGVPVGLAVASKSKKTLDIIRSAFCNDHFKLYPTNDIIGIEVCGAVKNIIAIASGMIDGIGYPISTQALLLTQSLHDIKELIYELGGSKKTILSFAGFGDIILTCTSEKSRNYTFGKLIGSNASKEEIEEYKNNMTVEGLYTLKSIYGLMKKEKIEIPTINIIYDIVFKDEKIDKLIEHLMI